MSLTENRLTNIMLKELTDYTKLRHEEDKFGNPSTDYLIKNTEPKLPEWNKRHFLDIWQKELDMEFQRASQSNPNFLITPPAGTLIIQDSFATSHSDWANPTELAYYIAVAVCVYWSKTIVNGIASHDSSVVSVVNDSMSKVEILKNRILNNRTVISRGSSYSYYSGLYNSFHHAIFKTVREITWLVTEMDGKGNTRTYNEKVF